MITIKLNYQIYKNSPFKFWRETTILLVQDKRITFKDLNEDEKQNVIPLEEFKLDNWVPEIEMFDYSLRLKKSNPHLTLRIKNPQYQGIGHENARKGRFYMMHRTQFHSFS